MKATSSRKPGDDAHRVLVEVDLRPLSGDVGEGFGRLGRERD